MMPNGDPRDGFFYTTLTLMIDSYSTSEAFAIANPPPNKKTTPHGTFSAATFQDSSGLSVPLSPTSFTVLKVR